MGKRLTDEERAYRALSEKQYQARVMKLARAYGWRVAHFSDSRKQVRPGVHVGDTDARGFPDLALIRPPEFVVIELKAELGKTTEHQDEWLADFAASGIDAFVSRPSTFSVIEERLTRARLSPI